MLVGQLAPKIGMKLTPDFLQEEDKRRREEAEQIMAENQKKIEEQQRKMVRSIFLIIS